MSNEKQLLIHTLIDDDSFAAADKFSLLASITRSSNEENDLAILVAMRLSQGKWSDYSEIAASYVRSMGLFPYLPDELTDQLSTRDTLAREIYRSPSREGIFMHRAQFSVLQRLLKGESIILSAPTSFGKSFLMEELLLSEKYDNVLIIVPTVALIEEIRQKIKKLELPHSRISFTNQGPTDKNIFILTQERAYEMYGVIAKVGIDLLVIDEFYKMDSELLEDDDSDRANMLSVVYHKFSSIAKQVYLLGPYINGADGYKTFKHNPTWIESDDNTTYIVREHIKVKPNERGKKTLELVKKHKKDIMVYCSSPTTLRDFYKEALHDSLPEDDRNDDFIEWINENIGPEWYINDALKRGVGVHHGKLPRFIAHEMIKRFAEGKIDILLCTSSLIEGVNTNAKTIIIYNGKRKFPKDILTFRNISGRAGRMFSHFWGTVYYYEEPSQDSEIIVKDPIGTEKDSTPSSTLSLLDDTHLSNKQSDLVNQRYVSTYIPDDILRLNHFIEIDQQELVLSEVSNEQLAGTLGSIHRPSLDNNQMRVVFSLASKLGLRNQSYAYSINGDFEKSIARLCILTNSYLSGGFRNLASDFGGQSKIVSDDSIEFSFYFLKNGMNYDFPKYIRALNRLQKYALGTASGDLEPFANRLEYLDTEPVYVQLDELGLPVEFSKKYLIQSSSLEGAVNHIKNILPRLNGIEKEMASDLLLRY